MVCDVTLVCAQVRSVILSRELSEVPDRNRSLRNVETRSINLEGLQ